MYGLATCRVGRGSSLHVTWVARFALKEGFTAVFLTENVLFIGTHTNAISSWLMLYSMLW